jgi:hypothetical protein
MMMMMMMMMMMIIIIIIIIITIQHIPGTCLALAQGECTYSHKEVAYIVHFELAIKCGPSEGPATPYYKYVTQSMLGNSSYELHYDRSITTHRKYQRFYLPTDTQVNCLKNNFKIYIKTATTCFGVIAIITERTNHADEF